MIKNLLGLSILLLAFSENSPSASVWLPSRILGIGYPHEARNARIEGKIEAKCTIRPDGSVAEVTIVSGHPVLARSVKANLIRWIFRHSEMAVRGEATVTYSFQLKGNCDSHKGCKEEFWFDYPDHVTIVSELPFINTTGQISKR